MDKNRSHRNKNKYEIGGTIKQRYKYETQNNRLHRDKAKLHAMMHLKLVVQCSKRLIFLLNYAIKTRDNSLSEFDWILAKKCSVKISEMYFDDVFSEPLDRIV